MVVNLLILLPNGQDSTACPSPRSKRRSRGPLTNGEDYTCDCCPASLGGWITFNRLRTSRRLERDWYQRRCRSDASSGISSCWRSFGGIPSHAHEYWCCGDGGARPSGDLCQERFCCKRVSGLLRPV